MVIFLAYKKNKIVLIKDNKAYYPKTQEQVQYKKLYLPIFHSF